MKILGFELKRAEKQEVIEQPKSAFYQDDYAYGHYYPILNKKWDGEKTLGELGTVVRNIPDFDRLRLRSYNAFATIDTVKIIANKFFFWTVGSGLKLQSEPNRQVLKSEGITNTDAEYTEFQQRVESRFLVYSNSKEMDYNKQKTLHELAQDAFQMEFLGGDFLVICRFDKNGITVQLISGEHVQTPSLDNDFIQQAIANGNYIDCGIEIDSKGNHVAYFVNTKLPTGEVKSQRIEAVGKVTKKRLVWLVAGNKISPDHLRSVPAMAQSLEKINKLDRYTEASVTKEEQSAKIVHTIEHAEYSTGENPLMSKVNQVRNGNVVDGDVVDNRVLADGLANRITETSSGTTYNMPNGATLKTFKADNASSFAEFYSTIFKSISAGVDVPPEVAMQEYNSNYSASRAAINSFGYIIDVKREKFAINFYKPIFELWLEFQILSKKIVINGYLEGIDNFMVTKSYSQCRFLGKNMPHIDPLKEIKAIRSMLGDKKNEETSLISYEQATEMLGAGEWSENFMKYQEEEKIIPKPDPIISNQTTVIDPKPKVTTKK